MTVAIHYSLTMFTRTIPPNLLGKQTKNILWENKLSYSFKKTSAWVSKCYSSFAQLKVHVTLARLRFECSQISYRCEFACGCSAWISVWSVCNRLRTRRDVPRYACACESPSTACKWTPPDTPCIGTAALALAPPNTVKLNTQRWHNKYSLLGFIIGMWHRQLSTQKRSYFKSKEGDKGNWPVCVRLWMLSVDFCANLLRQTSHW